MRVFHLIHQFPPERFGGAERHVEQIAREQAARHSVLIYTQSVAHHDGADASDEFVNGVAIRRWMDRGADAQSRLDADLRQSVERFAPDVVHIHHGIGFPPQTILDIASRYPCVLTLHDYWWFCPRVRLMFRGETPCPGPIPHSRCARCYAGQDSAALVGEWAALAQTASWGAGLSSARVSITSERADRARAAITFVSAHSRLARRWFFRKRRGAHAQVLRHCRTFVSPSRYLLDRYRAAAALPEAPAFVIPYGVAPLVAATSRDDSEKPIEGPIRLLFMGHASGDKGLGLALRAVEDLPSDVVRLRVVGMDRPADGLWAGRALPSNVEFTGLVPPERHGEIWADVHALVAPSIWVENAPKVVSEAHAAGVPVLAADHGALPEMTGPGRGGWLFTGLDAFALRSRIEQLIADPGEITRARAGIPLPVTLSQAADRLDEVYRSVLR